MSYFTILCCIKSDRSTFPFSFPVLSRWTEQIHSQLPPDSPAILPFPPPPPSSSFPLCVISMKHRILGWHQSPLSPSRSGFTSSIVRMCPPRQVHTNSKFQYFRAGIRDTPHLPLTCEICSAITQSVFQVDWCLRKLEIRSDPIILFSFFLQRCHPHRL